ncbi:hypothetical protein DL771_002718 [Monosporascus sp. 5C6A]|nr:hypothetical protein DL771_002718 [Monosporascus sp. 5C6A]
MDHLVIGENFFIKLCPDTSKGLGVFAARKLSKGLRILTDQVVLAHESREDMSASIGDDFTNVPPSVQVPLTRLFAGALDVVPLMAPGLVKDRVTVDPSRLQRLVRYNAIEAAGTGCILALLSSPFNHSISFVYESCNSPASETRRAAMVDPRRRMTQFYQSDASTQEGIYEAMGWLRELANIIEAEGLLGLELASVLGEQARLMTCRLRPPISKTLQVLTSVYRNSDKCLGNYLVSMASRNQKVEGFNMKAIEAPAKLRLKGMKRRDAETLEE